MTNTAQTESTDRNTVYEMVTQRMLESLSQNRIPWNRAWDMIDPINGISKKPYQGMNLLLLGMQEYKTPVYVSFKQAKDLGGSVKKGEHGHLIVFWKMLHGTDSQNPEKIKSFPMLRHSYVFNVEQCDGLPESVTADLPMREHATIQNAENIIASMPNRPHMVTADGIPHYRPSTDTVSVPLAGRFHTMDEYYSTTFHELAHSTGHESRLNRQMDGGIHTRRQTYSREELVAEITAAFIMARCGLTTTLENSAAYCQGWARFLADQPKAIVQASGQAIKACKYIMNEQEPVHA